VLKAKRGNTVNETHGIYKNQIGRDEVKRLPSKKEKLHIKSGHGKWEGEERDQN